MNRILTLTPMKLLIAFSVGLWHLTSPAQDIPEGAKTLLTKLETFEKEKRQEIDNEIKLKRAQVLELLKSQLTKHPPGSVDAKTVESAIDAVKNLDSSKPFKLNSIKVQRAPSNSKNTQINFELMLKRLAITSLNHDSKARLGKDHMLEVKLDNKVIFTAKAEGAYVLEIDPDGKMIAHTFKHLNRREEREIAAERDRMISTLHEINPAHVIVIAKASACNVMSLNGEADDIVEIIGGRVKKLLFRKPYICIGYRGLRRGDAVEVEGADQGDALAVYPPKKN